MSDVTRILSAIEKGKPHAADQLLIMDPTRYGPGALSSGGGGLPLLLGFPLH
jgi:hypothetical protein